MSSLHTDCWIGTDQNDVVGDINESMTKKFRQGKFEDQTKEVKEAFYFCMLTLMLCVNNEWQRAEVQLHAKLSDITAVSDEAILYWFLTYFQGQWLQETKEEEEHKATHSDMRPPKRNKRQGISTMHFQWFHDMETEPRANRAEALSLIHISEPMRPY